VVDTGWTWDQVGRLTVPRFKALARQWRKTPPLNRLLAAALGLRASDQPRGDLAGFVRAMTGAAPPE
jgi:hypothetical protein